MKMHAVVADHPVWLEYQRQVNEAELSAPSMAEVEADPEAGGVRARQAMAEVMTLTTHRPDVLRQIRPEVERRAAEVEARILEQARVAQRALDRLAVELDLLASTVAACRRAAGDPQPTLSTTVDARVLLRLADEDRSALHNGD